MNGDKQQGLDALPSKTAFYVGVGGGILVVLAIGFFVLLGIMVKGGSVDLDKGSDKQVAANTNGSEVSIPSVPTAPPSGVPPVVTERDHVRGDLDASVTIIEYSDFECPYCTNFHGTMKQVIETYPNDVSWVYRHFPLSSLHPGAQKKAEASECVWQLGGDDAFWAFADAVFSQQPAVADLGSFAAQVAGVNQNDFQNCLDSGDYASFVNDHFTDGANAGVTGTPGSFIIDGGGASQLVPGALPFESVSQIIDSIL